MITPAQKVAAIEYVLALMEDDDTIHKLRQRLKWELAVARAMARTAGQKAGQNREHGNDAPNRN